ncbi:hypothetical protein CCYA_CCYA10G2863 [Cyanidiococcus yangmingshanensis]|nr:hypothetical protein CCYA_CCYA10G2863 [Cyanidiococcus yangmingshanensis]
MRDLSANSSSGPGPTAEKPTADARVFSESETELILREILLDGSFDELRSGILEKLRASGELETLRVQAQAVARGALERHEDEVQRAFLASVGRVEDAKRSELLALIRAELYRGELSRVFDRKLQRALDRGEFAEKVWQSLSRVYARIHQQD